MTYLDKRFDGRIPMETYLTAYIGDRPIRGFTTNISESGLYLNTLPDDPKQRLQPVGLELALPGMRETLWIAGELRYGDLSDPTFNGHGIRFKAMAKQHSRMLREFCYQARRRHGRRAFA
jgi:hypothetical protein